MVKVHLSLDGQLFLLSTQFFIETVLADNLNVLAHLLVTAASLESLHNFLADRCLKYSYSFTVNNTNSNPTLLYFDYNNHSKTVKMLGGTTVKSVKLRRSFMCCQFISSLLF